MSKRKGGLGRGLSALIPDSAPAEHATQQQTVSDAEVAESHVAALDTDAHERASGLLRLQVTSIDPNPRQPRQSFPTDKLEELADSIRTHGVLQPLLVTRASEAGRFHLLAGERRWRASILAGLDTVPAVLKEATSRDLLEIALVENVQRADLNPLEEAAAYHALVEEFGLKQDEVAARVGKSRVAVGNTLRLLNLPQQAQDALSGGLITEGHARAILQVPHEVLQLRLLEQIIATSLNVRQAEALARRLAETTPDSAPEAEEQKPLYSQLDDLQEQFRNALGTKVALSRSRNGGKLVIYFYSDEELDRIYGAIVGEE